MYTFTTSSYLYPFSVYVTIHTFSWIAKEKKIFVLNDIVSHIFTYALLICQMLFNLRFQIFPQGFRAMILFERGGVVVFKTCFQLHYYVLNFTGGGGCPPDSPLDPCMSLEIFSILFEWKGLIFERNNVYIVTILFEVQWPSGVGYNSFWEKIFSLIVF